VLSGGCVPGLNGRDHLPVILAKIVYAPSGLHCGILKVEVKQPTPLFEHASVEVHEVLIMRRGRVDLLRLPPEAVASSEPPS
jgi:hypothetical protein